MAMAAMEKLADGSHPNTIAAVATAQEELGLRVATTCAEVVNPDVAIVLECGIATDVPGTKDEITYKFGGGPAVQFCEARMITNVTLRDIVVDTAEENELGSSSACWEDYHLMLRVGIP